MSDYNKTQDNNKIPIPPLKKFMDRQEFQEYLVLVKSIANFDPNTKKWYISEKKISSINPSELRKIAIFLKDYVGDEIFNILGKYLSNNKSSVYAILKGIICMSMMT